MSDHETTLRELAAGLLARGRIDAEEPSSASQRADIIRKSERNADACLTGADALRRGTCGTCKHVDTSNAQPGTGACFGPSGSIDGWVPLHASCKFHAPTEPTR